MGKSLLQKRAKRSLDLAAAFGGWLVDVRARIRERRAMLSMITRSHILALTPTS